MKFRLRGDAFKTPTVIEFEGSDVTVSMLKFRVSEILHLSEKEMRDIKLSMNGKQVLSCEEDQTLSSLGFVSGDVIYIVGVQSRGPLAETQKCENINHTQQELNQTSREHHPVVMHPNTSKEALASSGHASLDTRNETTHITRDDHHTPISETQNGVVPQNLQDLTQNFTPHCSSPFEEVAGLIHILMVETGFLPITQKTEQNAYNTLPDSWQVKNGILKLQYKTALSPNTPCLLILSCMKPLILMTIHGLASGGIEKTMKLKLTDYLPIVGGNRLRQLSLSFKNEISFPLLVSMQRQVEGICPANLSNLPPELLNNILVRLDVKSLSRLSATSRFFREISNQPEIWKKLVLRDFKDKYSRSSRPTDWKRTYQDEHRLARQRRFMTTAMTNYRPPFNPFGYLGGPFSEPQNNRSRINFPGIIGGEEDLRPNLGPFAPPMRRNDPFQRGTGLPPFMNNRYRGFPPF